MYTKFMKLVLLSLLISLATSATDLDVELIEAAKKGETSNAEALLAQGANVKAADERGRTSLHRAGFAGHTSTVEALLAHGANVNATDKQGNTPLHGAAFSGHTECLRTAIDSNRQVVKVWSARFLW